MSSQNILPHINDLSTSRPRMTYILLYDILYKNKIVFYIIFIFCRLNSPHFSKINYINVIWLILFCFYANLEAENTDVKPSVYVCMFVKAIVTKLPTQNQLGWFRNIYNLVSA